MGPTHINNRLAFSVKSLAGHIGEPLKKGDDTLFAYLSNNGISPIPIIGHIVTANGVQQPLQIAKLPCREIPPIVKLQKAVSSPLTHQRFDPLLPLKISDGIDPLQPRPLGMGNKGHGDAANLKTHGNLLINILPPLSVP